MSNLHVSGGNCPSDSALCGAIPAPNTINTISHLRQGPYEVFRLPRLDLLTRLQALGDDPAQLASKDLQPSHLPPQSNDPLTVFDQVKPFLQQLRAQGFAEIDRCRKSGEAYTPLANLIFETTRGQDLHEVSKEMRALDPNSQLNRPAWQRNFLEAMQKIAPIVDFCSPALAAFERWGLQSPVLGTLGKIAGGILAAVASTYIIHSSAAFPAPLGGVVAALGATASLASYCYAQAHAFPLIYGFADRLEFNSKLKELLKSDPKAVEVVNKFLGQPSEL